MNTRRRNNPNGVPSLNADPSEHERIAEHERRWNESARLRAQGLEVEEVAVGEVIVRPPQARESQLHSRLIQNPDHERRQA